jgi:hypothetical protein
MGHFVMLDRLMQDYSGNSCRAACSSVTFMRYETIATRKERAYQDFSSLDEPRLWLERARYM